MTTKYGKKAQEEVKKEMHRFKKGTAKSGPTKKKVKSREQAIAIGLSKARKKGAKVPKTNIKTTFVTGLLSSIYDTVNSLIYIQK